MAAAGAAAGATIEGGAFRVDRCGLESAAVGAICVRNGEFADCAFGAEGDALPLKPNAPAKPR